MTKSPTRNSSLWLACAGVLLVATAGAVAGPAQALLQGGASTLAARKVLLSDAVFTAGAVLFLEAGLWWGLRWHPAAAPYRGAWLTATGGRELPAGFAAYLPLAGLLAFLLPAAALGYLLASGRAAAGLVLLGGYTAVFFVQMLLETRLFHSEPLHFQLVALLLHVFRAAVAASCMACNARYLLAPCRESHEPRHPFHLCPLPLLAAGPLPVGAASRSGAQRPRVDAGPAHLPPALLVLRCSGDGSAAALGVQLAARWFGQQGRQLDMHSSVPLRIIASVSPLYR